VYVSISVFPGLVRVEEIIRTFLINEDVDTKIELHPLQVGLLILISNLV
jgi:hypothetical protein